MTPEIRAIADRFMYEQATVKHIAALAPEGGLDRAAPGTSWSVRQLLGHMAQSLNDYAAMIERWVRGESPISPGWDPDAVNAETATRLANAGLGELMALFGTGINGLVAALESIPDERVRDQFGPAPLMETLRVFGGHCLGHAFPLVDALPEVRMDALVLNWLLEAEVEGEDREAWQAGLLAEAREYVASLPDEEEDE